MSELARRDRLGARRVLFHPATGAWASDLRALLARVPEARAGGLDPLGVDAAFGLAEAPDRTCLQAVRAVPPGMVLAADDSGRASAVVPAPARLAGATSLAPALLEAVSRALASSRRPVVALGGGLDAPLAVLAARRAGIAVTDAIHLAIPGTSYDEAAEARRSADALGLELHEIAISVEELARALPLAVRIAETPLYNLHPVSRAVLTRIAKERGHDALLTGDGADQAARGATEAADYVPIVAAITTGAGLALASPFVDDAVVGVLAAARDPEKHALRELAVAWGLPASLAARPKVPALAPPFPRASYPRSLAWSNDDDRANVRAASLAAFVAAFEL